MSRRIQRIMRRRVDPFSFSPWEATRLEVEVAPEVAGGQCGTGGLTSGGKCVSVSATGGPEARGVQHGEY